MQMHTIRSWCCVQAAVQRRDAEIHRLAMKAEKGPDANQMNLRFKNETNESIILQLNSQASILSMHSTCLATVLHVVSRHQHLTCLWSDRNLRDQVSKRATLSLSLTMRHLMPLTMVLLTLQVDFVTTQMTEMQREVDDKQRTEAALKKAEQAQKEVCLGLEH